MAPPVGLEPTTARLTAACSTNWAKEECVRLWLNSEPVLALPIFPGRRQPSIVGRNELNYRVRNGNGWTLALISTNCVVAKSALLRFRLRQKLRTLPCSSFSSRIRFAGFRSDQDLRLYVIRSSGEHSVLYCLFRALSRGSLFDLQTSAAFEDREGKAAEGVSFRTSCGSKRSAACFDVVTRTGFEPMLTAWEAAVLTTWPTGHGAPSRTRTGDPLIKSQLLYQLS